MRTHSVCRTMLGCGLALLLTAGLAPAQEPKLPDGLKHVPLDALGFVHFRAGDFLKSIPGQALFQQIRADREAGKGLSKLEKTFGIAASDLESVTVIVLASPSAAHLNSWDGPGRYRTSQKERDWEMRMKMEKDLKW